MAETPILLEEVATYLNAEDVAHVREVVEFSRIAHEGQTRRSGEPYVSHPIAVARILARLHLDTQGIVAALLHDVVEDTPVSGDEIAERFGKPVADLVDGVSKLEKIHFETREDAQAENFRKMLLAMSRDVRVILIKLADRLHNMRTLGVMKPEKCERIARETMEIYAPIANRLGLNEVYHELQELSFKYLNPTRYGVLVKALKAARGNRKEVLDKILASIKACLAKHNIKAEVSGREKNIYSIYKKMQKKHLGFADVFDIYGFRVLVEDQVNCYVVMGILHSLYSPVPGKFKDYIALPKLNGYQSLHTSLNGPFSTPIEIQIRTFEMHRIAEAGVAAHWLYKSGHDSITDLHRKTHQWLHELLESLSHSDDSAEFLEHLKVDLFPGEVYVSTPKGKIFALPRGSTPIDFAYSIHTEIGNTCISAKINHELVPLRTELRSGDRVEILTAPYARPNLAWLGYVRTSKARANIRHFLKTLHSGEAVKLGRRLLEQAYQTLEIDPDSISEPCWEKLLKEIGLHDKSEVLQDIGLGRRFNVVVARQLSKMSELSAEEVVPHNSVVTIEGTEGMAVQFAQCCRPIQGTRLSV